MTDTDPMLARQRDALFAAVLVHDTVDLDAVLPVPVPLDYAADRFARFFAVARAVWADGADRRTLARIATAALSGRPLAPRRAAAFKDVRARFKQLRFAYVMFDRTHDHPAALHRITRVMGQLQDALKHGRRGRIVAKALYLRALAMRAPFARIVHGVDRFEPSAPPAFRAFVDREMRTIRAALSAPEITGRRFHETRKVVSRLVAMFDCVATIEPTPAACATVRYLSTINGLMGGLHDDMVARRLDGTRDYEAETFPLPEPIATRLRALEAAIAAAD